MTGAESDPLRARKAELRKRVLAARDAIAPRRAHRAPPQSPDVLALDAWESARCVLAYLSFGSEFDTAALIEKRVPPARSCLPRVDYAARGELHTASTRRRT